jgi:hypothetical protein
MKKVRKMRLEHWLFTIRLRLRSLFRWAQADQELDDELRDHLERKTEEYVAKGMAPEEARRRAWLDLGGIEKYKEECRDTRRVNWIQDFIQSEMAIRSSLGATRARIITQLLTGNLLLAFVGGTLGTLGALGASLLLCVLLAWVPADIPRLFSRISISLCSCLRG